MEIAVMSGKTQAANPSRSRTTTRKPSRRQAKARGVAAGATVGDYSTRIIDALIDAEAFSYKTAITVAEVHRITGIKVEHVQLLACQIATPGLAVIEGPTPATSEAAIKRLYVETDGGKIFQFALSLARMGSWALGRASIYAKNGEPKRS